MTEDKLILEGLKRGETDSLQTLIDKYGRYAAAVSAKVSSGKLSSQDIEEVTADVFIAVWKTASRIDPDGNTLKAYIGSTARNRTFNEMRKSKHKELQDIDDHDNLLTIPGAEESFIEQEGARQLELLIDDLKEPDREIFIRRYFFMEKVMDIAGRLNMNEKAVSARIARMKQRLQESCMKEGAIR